MLLVGLQFGGVALGVFAVDVAVLEGAEGANLAVEVVCHDLKAAEDERLAHDVELLAQGVDYLYAGFCGERLEPGIVVFAGERVVHDLREAVGGEESGDAVAGGFRVGVGGRRDGHLHVMRQVDVVVAVDAEDFLNHIALAGYVHHVRWGQYYCSLCLTGDEFILQRLEDTEHVGGADVFADEVAYTVEIQLYAGAFKGLGAYFLRLPHYGASCALHYEGGSTLEGIHGNQRVCTTLVTERCICLQAEALGGTADGCRVEVGALEEYVSGAFSHTAVFSSEDAADAHGTLGICNYHVCAAELAFYAVEGDDSLLAGFADGVLDVLGAVY